MSSSITSALAAHDAYEGVASVVGAAPGAPVQVGEAEASDEAPEQAPWFTIFNAYYGPQQTVTCPFIPFPASQFPPHSPWEDTQIIAHFGIEPYARAAGFSDVGAFLISLIRAAATGAN